MSRLETSEKASAPSVPRASGELPRLDSSQLNWATTSDAAAPTPRAEPDWSTTKILVVEHGFPERQLVRSALNELRIAPECIQLVDTLTGARHSLATVRPDCILLDLALPDAAGLEAVTILVAAAPDVPIVVISDDSDGPLAYTAMAEGADECVAKADLDVPHLGDAIRRAFRRRRGSWGRERYAAGNALILDSIDAPTVVIDGSGRILATNRGWKETAAEGGADLSAVGEGVNYLEICDRATGTSSDSAHDVGAGIRRVLFGEDDQFSIDYPCSREGRARWFSLRVTQAGDLGGGAVLTHLEITHLKLAEIQFRERDVRLYGSFDESAEFSALLDRHGSMVHMSPSAAAFLGSQQHQDVGGPISPEIDPRDQEKAKAAFGRILSCPGHSERLELRLRDVRGQWRTIDMAFVNLLDDPNIGAVAITGFDITQGRLSQIARRLEVRLLQTLPAAIVVTDDQGVIVYWNDRASAMYGYLPDQVLGRSIGEFDVVPAVAISAARSQLITERSGWEGDHDAICSDGSRLPTHATVARVVEDEINFRGTVTASVDASERRRLEEELSYQATHDVVTGLPNRRMLVHYLETSLESSRSTGPGIGVLFIDLDDFKLVNDRLGHVWGDQMLRTVGTLITGVLRAGDMVARIGGDEFVVCCGNLDGQDAYHHVADRIIDVLATHSGRQGEPAGIGASIGIAVSSHDSSAEGLLRRADIAMYAAKQSGKARAELFDDELHDRTQRSSELAVELANALDAHTLTTCFQPVIRLADSSLVGFEALVRWTHPQLGIVPPDEFISIAERWGLIGQLGRAVLEDSCLALRAWLDQTPHRPLTVAVNVSPLQLADAAFPEVVREILERSGVPAGQLCLEVTESILIDVDLAAGALRVLKEMGVQIAIDDFGTGYSSLSRLHQCPLDFLKIDRSFVSGMNEKKEADVIVACVLALSKGLGIETIAEGIEDEEQLERLSDAGCELAQGLLWSPAVPLDEANRLASAVGPIPFAKLARTAVVSK